MNIHLIDSTIYLLFYYYYFFFLLLLLFFFLGGGGGGGSLVTYNTASCQIGISIMVSSLSCCVIVVSNKNNTDSPTSGQAYCCALWFTLIFMSSRFSATSDNSVY